MIKEKEKKPIVDLKSNTNFLLCYDDFEHSHKHTIANPHVRCCV